MKSRSGNVLAWLLFGLGLLVMMGLAGCDDRVSIPANASLDKAPLITIHALRSGTIGTINKPDITSVEDETFSFPKFCMVSPNMKLVLMTEATNTVGGVEKLHINVKNSKDGRVLYDLTANGTRDAANTGPVTLRIFKPSAEKVIDMTTIQELLVSVDAVNFNGQTRSLSVIYVPTVGY